MSQATLFERPRKRPANSMAAKLWEAYGTNALAREVFKNIYRSYAGDRPGRAADRKVASYLQHSDPVFTGVTWRVVQDFRLKLGPAMGGGTHPHRGSKRAKVRFQGRIESAAFYPRAFSSEEIERDIRKWRDKKGEGHMRCCDVTAALEPKEPPAAPEPLPGPGPVEYVRFNSEPFLVDHAKRLEQEFLEVLLMAGQVGLEPGRISPEEAAQIAKRAAKALVEA